MTKFNIAASLRPDYYEWFPNFSDEELIIRLRYMPFARATLLTIENISRAISIDRAMQNELLNFLQSPYRAQRNALAQVLRHAGIPENVCQAIGTVPREYFAPPETAQYSYLNTYLPWDSASCVTAPGLVALMLTHLKPTGGKIVEVGIGSGYHAACVAELCPPGAVINGIEFNEIYADFGVDCLRRAGYNHIGVSVGDANRMPVPPSEIDILYCTAAGSLDLTSALLKSIRVGGIFQFIRPLTSQEFENEKLPWLRNTYGTYEEYLDGNWQNYGCISSQQREPTGFVEKSRLFDVKLVTLRSGNEDIDLIGRDEWLDTLRDLCSK